MSHWCHKGFCTSRWGSGWGSNTDRNFEVAQWRCLRISLADQGMYGALRSARDLKRWCVYLCIVRWLECQQKGVFIFSEALMIHQSHLGSQPSKNHQLSCLFESFLAPISAFQDPSSIRGCRAPTKVWDSLGHFTGKPEICPLKENVSCKCSFKVYIHRNSNRF